MRKIIHLSDLHFGSDRPELLEPLIEAVNGENPDVVAISGDLTQRARASQFAAARRFIDRIQGQVLAVPGNHDIPLDRPITRAIAPFGKYRKWISQALEPSLAAGDMAVFGLNTVTRFSWQRGHVRRSCIDRLCRLFEQGPPDRINILVAHHPFAQDCASGKTPMRGASEAIERLADCGAHVVLSGHLHTWHTEPFMTRSGHTKILQIHAGTGLSSRLRKQDNDFALLEIEGNDLCVTRYIADTETTRFVKEQSRNFSLDDKGWTETDATPFSALRPGPRSAAMTRGHS